MEHLYNDADKENLKNVKKNVSRCYIVHHKHMDRPGVEPKPPHRDADD
jgi:hypothetical protein